MNYKDHWDKVRGGRQLASDMTPAEAEVQVGGTIGVYP
jgi:hypothetical protein